MKERKELRQSQTLLIQAKRNSLNEIALKGQQAQAEFQNILNLIARELGIPEGERWRLSDDDKYLENTEKPKLTIPGRNNKK